MGYPRIGRGRELKRALEAYWSGKSDRATLETTARRLRAESRSRLSTLGLDPRADAIPEDFSYYDQVLDAAVTVGAVPTRFSDLRGPDGHVDLDGYFTLARGDGKRAPLEMTKWFNSNYHYLVPEIGPETRFRLDARRLLAHVAEAHEQGIAVRPVIVGPVTLLALSKPEESHAGFRPLKVLDAVVAVYGELLERLAAAGVRWVQFDEPALVSEGLEPPAGAGEPRLADLAAGAYRTLQAIVQRPAIHVAAPYGDLGDGFQALALSGVEAIGLDLVHGDVPACSDLDLSGLTLVGGVVDGHNVWRTDLGAALAGLRQLRRLGASVSVSTSTSLFHVPYDVGVERALPGRLQSWLAFADQKVEEVVTLGRALTDGEDCVRAALDASAALLAERAAAPGVRDAGVRERAAALDEAAYRRGDYETRRRAQARRLGLPLLPTTTIGSFPQTADIRRSRAAFARGELGRDDYVARMRKEIRDVIERQERLGLDVLVHGEAERNDMVQYFAENLAGFAVTRDGWVQSYGSRCTRPSILWGDVRRTHPITVEWSSYAQSLTDKPVKGMLTGPVTILAWSFVRDDQPLASTATQVALALRDEIADLEKAGLAVIQVDEPALRELLPLKRADQPDYLAWSVDAFRLATAGAADDTQVHTHLCYSEFGVVMDAIRRLDADVTSIEAARSRMEVVTDIVAAGFRHGIGPGVYDIHSPRVPGEEEIQGLLRRAVDTIDARQVWVNPDCGLKTRTYAEVTPSLEHLVEAARTVRAELAGTGAVATAGA
ncbi:MAG TPA: 5-methyltetrahydropteroyltriglutamate--homocysteine S-methyltransferase [Microbacteriaceae bacterium]|nr:5-methyltetrahydropteroyltriglutamate--homocysteine S-methyltransferase [Microbacteriaceae bacterium]